MNKTGSIQQRMLRLRYSLFCLGKTFRARKKKAPLKSSSDKAKDKNTFIVINDEGKEVLCNVLFTFDSDEKKHYIVYTDNTEDHEGNIQVYASMYNPRNDDQMELLPIETSEEWSLVEDILTDIQEKIRNGKYIESDDVVEEDEEDEVLEALPVAIVKQLTDWSERLHFPVGALLPYIIGLFIFSHMRTDMLPIWVDAGLVCIELLIMRISYNDIEDTHVVVSSSITFFLYMASLMFLVDLLSAKFFRNLGRVTFEPWVLRVAIIVVSIFFIVRDRQRIQKRRRQLREK